MNAGERSTWNAFETTDLDEAHAHLSANYMEIRVRTSVPAEQFTLGTELAHLGDVPFSRAAYRARTHLFTDPFEDPCFVSLADGYYRVADRYEDFTAPIGGAFLLVPERRHEVRLNHFRLTTVTLPKTLVQETARSLGGAPAEAEIRFVSGRPMSEALERHWLSSVAYAQRAILPYPTLVSNPLISGQARRVLAAVALTVFPNTTMPAPAETTTGETRRAAVRRAVEFIDANPARDIAATDIAAAARLGVPDLVEAFRTYLGTTPVAYLRRARLELAHRDLVAGHVRVASVTEVARRWGFLDPRRFITEYRRAYGRSPKETLRSS